MSRKRINFNEVCKDHSIRVCSYQALQKIGGCIDSQLTSNISNALRESSGISILLEDTEPLILFDSELEASDVRFTIAHELGHILLGHLDFRNKVIKENPAQAETEANIFAAVLIANDVLCRYGDEGD